MIATLNFMNRVLLTLLELIIAIVDSIIIFDNVFVYSLYVAFIFTILLREITW
jgi:hypothetical protein